MRGKKLTLFYLLCIFLLSAALLTVHFRSIWAQATNKADVALLANCVPSTELAVPSQISVEFNLGEDRTGTGLPAATAAVTGGPADYKSSGRILNVRWMPNSSRAVVFIEGPRAHYWAPCSMDTVYGDKIRLVAHRASGSPYSDIYFKQGSDRSGQLVSFSEAVQGPENPVELSRAPMDRNTAIALFGEGTSAPYTIAATMELSTEMNIVAKTQIILGIIND